MCLGVRTCKWVQREFETGVAKKFIVLMLDRYNFQIKEMK